MPLTADIDGTPITEFCQSITWSPRWNVIDSASVRYPAQSVTITEGISELHLYLGATLVFSGPVWYSQAEGNPDSAYTELTGYDHRIYLAKRQAKDASGNLITPHDVILDNVTAPEILAAFITHAIGDTDAASFDPDGPFGPTGPSAALPLTLGTVDTGGSDVTGVPMDFPMTIERMRSMLTSTGQLDQVLVPGIGSSTLHLLNDYSNDSGVDFGYGTGSFNCQVATKTVDMEVMSNALWYLMGPRCTKERWRGSITPTAPHPGVGPGDEWPTALLTRLSDSRIDYGYMQDLRVFDDEDGDCSDPTVGANAVRPLFEEEWANEAWIRAMPRQFASVRPQRGIAPTNFQVGDLVGVAAGSIINGGFSGDQHVYGFDFTTDADGVDEFEEILTSPDQIGATGAT